jgi:hypothetical protein
MLLGAVVAAAGVLVSVLGLAGAGAFDVAVKSFAFDSTSTGLMVVAFGAALVAGVAVDPRDDAYRYNPATATAGELAQRRVALPAVMVMSLGLMLFVASILF